MDKEYRGSELELAHRQIGDYKAALRAIIKFIDAGIELDKIKTYAANEIERIQSMTATNT